MLKKKSKNDQVLEMVNLTIQPFNDIFKSCSAIAKEWGNENIIALVTINATVDIAIKNAEKMKGKNVKLIRDNHILTLKGLKTYCEKAATEMGTITIPRSLFKMAIEQVKTSIRKGAGL